MPTYLITGGTGTLGSALCSKLLSEGHKVRAYARNEHRMEALQCSLDHVYIKDFSPILGSVEDLERLRLAMRGVDIVIHAAAQKIVPLAEYNPLECVRTNTLGSANVARACIDAGVSKAVLVSTDKASSPATLYGASKLCAERLWCSANAYSAGTGTVFSALRWGNVWSSQGSVIHRWIKSPAIEVTDHQMTRFHITIDEAVNFVLESQSAEAGELRVPVIPSYRLGDLAEAYAGISGKPVKVIGIRASEKLHESLISTDESIYSPGFNPKDRYRSLFPGKVLGKGGWEYTSGNNTWRLGNSFLKDLVSKSVEDAKRVRV